jgi:solute carrier family 25 oxoglutarate transporter 11
LKRKNDGKNLSFF